MKETKIKTVQVGLRVDLPTLQILKQICVAEDRPLGYVVRKLTLRGLAKFNIDGKLRDAQTAETTGVSA